MFLRFRFYFFINTRRLTTHNFDLRPSVLYSLLISYLFLLIFFFISCSPSKTFSIVRPHRGFFYKKTKFRKSITKSPLAQRQWAQEQYCFSYFTLHLSFKLKADLVFILFNGIYFSGVVFLFSFLFFTYFSNFFIVSQRLFVNTNLILTV